VPSETVRARTPWSLARTGVLLAAGTAVALNLMRRSKPAAAVGFGGYPTVPPIMAAKLRRVPTLIHDQNAVLGRANKFLAPRVDRIAVASPVLKLPPELAAKAILTGNPVRPGVREAAEVPYSAIAAGGPLRLLVFGGSQGARFLSEAVPAAVGLLPADLRARLAVTQQCRPEDLAAVEVTYRHLGVAAELAPFFHDLPQRIAASHLVIARSGAGTVAELAVIGRPSILIPLPGAIDQDQTANARTLADVGGAVLLQERGLTTDALAAALADLLSNPARLAAAAAAARSRGIADGAERLADLVEAIARRS
jgi:UDP-N-acetylglucosamine--N-acetylmuramyl-(pentapeptide) pyrophosphoryl-undecaprenol N-acetylglucosamine transferase